MGTGLIYAAIVAAWAAYLVPLWLRRQDEAVAAREEGMTMRGRVVRRSKPTPAESDHAGQPAEAELEPIEEYEPVPVGPTSAARRRRTLLVLLVATTLTAVVAAVGFAPWWTAAIPGGLVVLFIGLSAVAASRERRRRARGRAVRAAARRRARSETNAATRTAEPPESTESPAEEVAINRRRQRDDGLWDPISVPLPTYVTKAKAPRTVRTISLSDPDTWTSGRLRDANHGDEAQLEPADLVDVDTGVDVDAGADVDPGAATGTDDAAPRG